MKIWLKYGHENYKCDLSRPLDISIPVGQVRCFYADPYEAKPLVSGDFIGSVAAGAPVNFFNVRMNPHGHGTHTETLGHLTKEQESINGVLNDFHFIARVLTVPISIKDNGDRVITDSDIKETGNSDYPEALIIRTLPNTRDKLSKDYSGTNPPYMTRAAMQFIVAQNVEHLLLDLPSVDKEIDGGQLEAHRIFWNISANESNDGQRANCTITELVFVDNDISDGLYLLNLQIPSLELDAAPSKPVLYKLEVETSN